MKTIFRSLTFGLILGSVIALGAVAGYAQDPCADVEGYTKMQDEFDKLYADKVNLDVRLQAINSGKAFVEKYGNCDSTKERTEWLKANIPGMEDRRAKAIALRDRQALLARFDTAMDAKNWNEVYASGKLILAQFPDEFRLVELVLGSIGLDETQKSPSVTTWNEDTLKYARMSIADLESGKTFSAYGIKAFTYKNKEDALGWMNYTVGYITAYGKNNKKDALPYLYKASQLASDTKSNPIVYASIGAYYYDEARKLAGESDALVKDQKDTDTPEVAKAKADAIDAKVGMLNGTLEAAIDAYGRANSLAKASPAKYPKAYTDSLYKKIQELYSFRFNKTEGIDAFVSASIAKPFRDPSIPVTPVLDPKPVAPVTGATTPGTTPGTAPATTGTGPAKPGTTTAKPPVTAPIKPAATSPANSSVSKPKAGAKKPVAKKKTA